MRTHEEIYELLKNPHLISIILASKEFLSLWKSQYYWPSSRNTGILFGKIIECPNLTQADIDQWHKECLDELKEIVRGWIPCGS